MALSMERFDISWNDVELSDCERPRMDQIGEISMRTLVMVSQVSDMFEIIIMILLLYGYHMVNYLYLSKGLHSTCLFACKAFILILGFLWNVEKKWTFHNQSNLQF